MSKKHFIRLADVVREQRPDKERYPYYTTEGHARLEQWCAMRDALADFCQEQNSAFNRQRWLAYIAGECGPNGGKA